MIGVVMACHVTLGCMVFHTGEYDTSALCWADINALATALVIDPYEDVRMAFCARRLQ
jgi:hypothetical protein|tara:strand:+ start:882 stop:1055 length:174 start_codon:yes stop_codon:yes gene_type:complete